MVLLVEIGIKNGVAIGNTVKYIYILNVILELDYGKK